MLGQCLASSLWFRAGSGPPKSKRKFLFFSLSLMTTTTLLPVWHHFGQPTLLLCLILTCCSVKRLFPFFPCGRCHCQDCLVTEVRTFQLSWALGPLGLLRSTDLLDLWCDLQLTLTWPFFLWIPGIFWSTSFSRPGMSVGLCAQLCQTCVFRRLLVCVSGYSMICNLYRVRRQTVFFLSYFMCVNLLQLILVPVVLFLAVR